MTSRSRPPSARTTARGARPSWRRSARRYSEHSRAGWGTRGTHAHTGCSGVLTDGILPGRPGLSDANHALCLLCSACVFVCLVCSCVCSLVRSFVFLLVRVYARLLVCLLVFVRLFFVFCLFVFLLADCFGSSCLFVLSCLVLSCLVLSCSFVRLSWVCVGFGLRWSARARARVCVCVCWFAHLFVRLCVLRPAPQRFRP
jgi:hypothetical protein